MLPFASYVVPTWLARTVAKSGSLRRPHSTPLRAAVRDAAPSCRLCDPGEHEAFSLAATVAHGARAGGPCVGWRNGGRGVPERLHQHGDRVPRFREHERKPVRRDVRLLLRHVRLDLLHVRVRAEGGRRPRRRKSLLSSCPPVRFVSRTGRHGVLVLHGDGGSCVPHERRVRRERVLLRTRERRRDGPVLRSESRLLLRGDGGGGRLSRVQSADAGCRCHARCECDARRRGAGRWHTARRCRRPLAWE